MTAVVPGSAPAVAPAAPVVSGAVPAAVVSTAVVAAVVAAGPAGPAAPVAPAGPAAAAFRAALAAFPSGVTIVTTADRTGRWWGFTATSFCSLSLDPPLVLVCLAKDAWCHPAFAAAAGWVVHVVPADGTDLARRFATRGADKFGGGGFTPNADGLPVLAGACAVLECAAHASHDGGDHTILVGRVTAATASDSAPTVYFRRDFHALP